MVNISQINYKYPGGKQVFTNLSLTFEPGRIYGLLGKNGAGKTTLLRLITGMLFSNGGTISVAGIDPETRSVDLWQKLFFLPEEFTTPHISPKDYGKNYGCFYPNFSNVRFTDLLHTMEVDPSVSMHSMSFGQKKKAMICFALACGTPLLVMDEPTNGLDIPSKSTFRKLVAENLAPESTVIISTHQVRDLEQLIDAVTIIDESQILLSATIDQITETIAFRHLTPEDAGKVLYSEQTPHGTWGAVVNSDNDSTQVDMELLFNAAISNKQFFSENLLK